MSSTIVRWNARYAWVKFWDAYQACVGKLDNLSAQRKLGKEVTDDAVREVYQNMGDVFTKAFTHRITEVIKLTGPAMAPTLNRKGLADPAVSETLVVRKLRTPGVDNVRIGDVVSFLNPSNSNFQELMVRRVAALPGDVLENDDKEETLMLAGHCWVVADNTDMSPPHVQDSRSFGPLPMSNVEGRVIYAIRTPNDHGAVNNDASWEADDASVMEAETPEELRAESETAADEDAEGSKKQDTQK